VELYVGLGRKQLGRAWGCTDTWQSDKWRSAACGVLNAVEPSGLRLKAHLYVSVLPHLYTPSFKRSSNLEGAGSVLWLASCSFHSASRISESFSSQHSGGGSRSNDCGAQLQVWTFLVTGAGVMHGQFQAAVFNCSRPPNTTPVKFTVGSTGPGWVVPRP
jgi:hypothetical protein